MSKQELFVVPDTLADTPRAEVVMLLEEDEGAVVYQGLRQQFVELAKSPNSKRE